MELNKIDKYLKKFASNIEKSVRSRYYQLPNGIIRVSDHIGRNSSATISIIITKDGDYILHRHTTGEIRNITYTNLKKLVKSMGEYGDLFANDVNNSIIVELKSEIKTKNIQLEEIKRSTKPSKVKESGFRGAFNAFRKLSKDEKTQVCSLCGKTSILDMTPDELVTVMGSGPVQNIFKAKKQENKA